MKINKSNEQERLRAFKMPRVSVRRKGIFSQNFAVLLIDESVSR